MERYGRLTIISSESKGKHVRCKVRCDCGVEKQVYRHHLISGATTSCGCFYDESRSFKKNTPRSDRKPNAEASFNKVFLFYKRNAEKRGYDFNLDKEQFKNLTQQNCHYCKTPPLQESKSTQRKFVQIYKYNGIDRVDNTQGYNLTNCVPCCKICNRAKGNLALQEFKNWIRSLCDSSRE